ncbi:hypothetical protein GPECTOR_4g971 [Gonium pectorale]|uniref:Uncharacterized protein n=1 Tax=Gonium pectorale TaxID=33097 RepID=A0A150GYH6_GONPE|nr:hypothetical protein GPECTOR_4g971 [Gonium pectorale]|eukprot:KXZ54899.1 hypothetical protein GPECTOR_4g971 [Gonium pectorale]
MEPEELPPGFASSWALQLAAASGGRLLPASATCRHGCVIVVLDFLDLLLEQNPHQHLRHFQQQQQQEPVGQVAQPAGGEGVGDGADVGVGSSGYAAVAQLPLPLEAVLAALPAQLPVGSRVTVQQAVGGGGMDAGAGPGADTRGGVVLEWTGLPGGWRVVQAPALGPRRPAPMALLSVVNEAGAESSSGAPSPCDVRYSVSASVEADAPSDARSVSFGAAYALGGGASQAASTPSWRPRSGGVASGALSLDAESGRQQCSAEAQAWSRAASCSVAAAGQQCPGQRGSSTEPGDAPEPEDVGIGTLGGGTCSASDPRYAGVGAAHPLAVSVPGGPYSGSAGRTGRTSGALSSLARRLSLTRRVSRLAPRGAGRADAGDGGDGGGDGVEAGGGAEAQLGAAGTRPQSVRQWSGPGPGPIASGGTAPEAAGVDGRAPDAVSRPTRRLMMRLRSQERAASAAAMGYTSGACSGSDRSHRQRPRSSKHPDRRPSDTTVFLQSSAPPFPRPSSQAAAGAYPSVGAGGSAGGAGDGCPSGAQDEGAAAGAEAALEEALRSLVGEYQCTGAALRGGPGARLTCRVVHAAGAGGATAGMGEAVTEPIELAEGLLSGAIGFGRQAPRGVADGPSAGQGEHGHQPTPDV